MKEYTKNNVDEVNKCEEAAFVTKEYEDIIKIERTRPYL